MPLRRLILIVALLVAPPAVAAPESAPRLEPPPEIERLARAAARRHGLDPDLVLAIIRIESGFRVRARSPKGAMGLMQLMPGTARRFGVRDAWDPAQNLRGGCAYLAWLLDRYDGDLELAAAAYNAGERAVDAHGGVPPFAETRAYVAALRRLYPGRPEFPRPPLSVEWRAERGVPGLFGPAGPGRRRAGP